MAVAGGVVLGGGAAVANHHIRTFAYSGDQTSAFTAVEGPATFAAAGLLVAGLGVAGLSMDSAALATVGMLGAAGGVAGILWGNSDRQAWRY
jgi:hypothetical protein